MFSTFNAIKMTQEDLLRYSFLPFFLEEPIYLIEETPINIPFVGENKLHISILLHFSKGDLLKSNEFELLLRILNAIKLSQHEVAIVNWATLQRDITLQHLRHALSPQKMIVFGDDLAQSLFGKQLTTYQLHTIQQISVVVADSLTALLQERGSQRPKAKALWGVLQQFIPSV